MSVRNVSAGKVVNGRNGRPSLSTPAPKSGAGTTPRVGGHTSNNGNGKQGVGGDGC